MIRPSEDNRHQELLKSLSSVLSDYLGAASNEERIRQIVDERIAVRVPKVIQSEMADGRMRSPSSHVHSQFEELMGLVRESHRNILMVGPAGSGKTTLAQSVAHAMGLEFGFISLSAGVSETHLMGRRIPQADGTWTYIPSRFVQMYGNGGLFLLDEMDAADSNVMLAINAALANGVLANSVSGDVVRRHPDCYILASANTWGGGGDRQYVGRNQLDASTLDRFVLSTLFVNYDVGLERKIAHEALAAPHAESLLQWLQRLRETITAKRVRRVASTRLLVNAVSALKAGKPLEDVKKRYFQDWGPDELVHVQEIA